MASSLFNISTYSRFNLSESESDITVFVKEYGYRIKRQLAREQEGESTPFPSFAERKLKPPNQDWITVNYDKFFKETPNEYLTKLSYLSECGFILTMIYSPDGEFLIIGFSSGLIQRNMNDEKEIINQFVNTILSHYEGASDSKIWYPMFYQRTEPPQNIKWVKDNNANFIDGTLNNVFYNRWYNTEIGAVTSMTYSPYGCHIIVGHATGLIQMRHGSTGVVLATLRNIQFPPKPVYAIEYSRLEERVCYAACADGVVYRIEIPHIVASVENPPEFCIRADPALECMTTQFFGNPGILTAATPFISQRSPALSLGLTADETKLIVGYADTSIKVYDMETQESETTYKVHKLRLQLIPKKLQRMHFGQVCAVRCHDERPTVFASAAWDKTVRIWDTRCNVGCVMTFEGVDVCSDSIDLNRDNLIVGSWQPTEALTVWDIVARKRQSIVRVQNRRPDVDGEYIHACRYWRSTKFNRKGKYGIIGGSGTNCVEVINLHNRYITCSYPVPGTITAIASFEERIAFSGTAPLLSIVAFHDPKHEEYEKDVEPDYDYTKEPRWFPDDEVSDSTDVTTHIDIDEVHAALSSRPDLSAVSQHA